MTSPRELALWDRAVQEYASTPEDLFIGALRAADWRIVWAGIRGLGLKRTHPDPLLDLIERNTRHLQVEEVRLQLAWALAQFSDRVSIRDIISTIEPDSHPSLEQRLTIADYIGERRSRDGIPALRQLLQDPSDEVALWASLSLAKIGEESIDVIEQFVSSSSFLPLSRKGYLLNALGRIGTQRARIVAEKMFASDPDQLSQYNELFIEGLECAKKP